MRLGSGIGLTARRTVPLLNGTLAVIGDSIARGTQTGNVSSFTMLNLPGVSVNLTYAVSGYAIHNSGGEITNGGGYAQFYNPGKTNAVIWQRGTIDLGPALNFTDAQIYNELSVEIGKAKAAGLYTIVCTILPRADSNWTSTMESYRLAYNARVVGNAAGADLIIDLTVNGQMGAVANASDTTKYGDGLHPTLLGQGYLLNPTYNDALRTLLSKRSLVYTPTLATLTLTPTTATVGTAYTGTIGNKTNGSTITATSSDGTNLTVSGTSVTGTFSAAGSPTITLTETLSGATGSPNSTSVGITVASGTNYVRVQNLSQFTESGNGTSGYSYQPTSANYGSPATGYSNAVMPASDNQYLQVVFNSPISDGPLIGCTDQASISGINGIKFGAYAGTGVGGPYTTWNASASPTPNGTAMNVAAGDIFRLLRNNTAGTVAVQIARSGAPTSFTTLHTYSSVPASPLRLCIAAGTGVSSGTNGNLISTPTGSSGVA